MNSMGTLYSMSPEETVSLIEQDSQDDVQCFLGSLQGDCIPYAKCRLLNKGSMLSPRILIARATF